MAISLRFAVLLWAFCHSFSAVQAQTEYKVYPGDTNNDAVVNVRDLLPVGIAFGREVNAREDMDIDWAAKLALDSLGLFLPNTLVNFVHINTNGDQRIDEQDLDAIVLNYDSTIIPDLPPAWAPEPIAPVSCCPELRVYFDRDTAFLLDTFTAEIWLEIPANQPLPAADGILGLSFAFTYPLTNIHDQSTRILPDPEAADLMYVIANAQSVSAVKNLPPGRGEVAVAGRGVNAMISRRLIIKVGIVVEDMIFRSNTDRPFWIDILPESVLMVNDREEQFKFCLPPSDSIILSDRMTAVRNIDREAEIRLWPNPSSGSFQWELPGTATAIRLYSADGRLQWSMQIKPGDLPGLHAPGLPDGSYVLLIETEGAVFRKRLIIMK